MIISAESINSGEVIEADLCILGAGPAGLVLGQHFVGSEQRVYILESGGESSDQRADDLSDGEIIGLPYFPLSDTRTRVVGGSSHLWSEWLRARPLDPCDFEQRSWITPSGWPFGREHLDPFYRRAHEILRLGAYEYEPRSLGLLPDSGTQITSPVEPAVFRYSNAFDFEELGREIAESNNVCLVVDATALEVVVDDSDGRAKGVIASSANPQRFSVVSRVVALAAGGIENSRILLLSRRGKGLGNDSGLVGRHFMEHPTMRRGVVVPNTDANDDPRWSFFRMRRLQDSAVRGALVPSESTMSDKSIPNGMVLLTESDEMHSSEVLRSIASARDALRGEGKGGESGLRHAVNVVMHPLQLKDLLRMRRGVIQAGRRLQVSLTVEQVPTASSRVTLGRKLDRFGQPVAAVDWRLSGLERRTVRVLQESVDLWLRRLGLGHLEGFLGEERPPRAFRGEWHHLGTTRMAASPRAGVVDPHGEVHGVKDLYIVGGSVFPTGGYANPTLTIVAMCLRLAKRLESVLSRGVALGPIW